MGVRGYFIAAGVGLIFLWGRAAAAQPSSPGEAVTLPRPLSPIAAAYPDGASGDAVIKLEVVVGTDGAVQSVKLLEGAPPFSTAAMAAAAIARFEPAQRGGQPIVARFLLEVSLRQPPAPAAAAPSSSAAAAPSSPSVSAAAPGSAPATSSAPATRPETAPAPPPRAGPASAAPRPPTAPIDVTVEGDRGPAPAPEPAGVHLPSKALARIPGAFGDAFRAVEVLPGVVPYLSGLPYFYVRGATPTATGYLIDGIQVPLLFHVGAGPSVVAPQIISSVDVYPGGYPAAFGRQVGGILSAETIAPAPRWSAEATLGLIDGRAYVAAPLPRGLGTVFAAGRSSFTQAVLPLITQEVNLGYWDYQAGAHLRIGAADRVRLLAFGADDFLTQRQGPEQKTLYKGQFHRVDLAYEHGPEARGKRPLAGGLLSPKIDELPADKPAPRLRVAATFGADRTSLGGQGDLSALLGQLRSIAEIWPHRIVRIRAGAEVLAEDRRFDQAPLFERPPNDDGSFAEAFAPRSISTLGGFAELGLLPRPYLEIVAGLRADYFNDPAGGVAGVDPRASVRLQLLPWLRSVTALGIAHQRPSFVVPAPGVSPSASQLVLQEGRHLSQAIEVDLPAAILVQATGYLHDYEGLTDFLATCGPGKSQCPFYARAGGRSYGLELMIQRSLTERLGAQISYTLSRTERTVDRETFAADSDRTHVLHVIVGYEPAPGWYAGARVTAYSGRPYSLVAYDNPYDANEGTLVGQRNLPRRPGFFRLDAKVSKTWQIGGRGYLTTALEGLNVTLQKETIDVDCRAPLPGQTCGPQEFGPVTIGNLSVTGGF